MEYIFIGGRNSGLVEKMRAYQILYNICMDQIARLLQEGPQKKELQTYEIY